MAPSLGKQFLQVNEHGSLGLALHTARKMGTPTYVLFPAPEAQDLADMVSLHSQQGQRSEQTQHTEAGVISSQQTASVSTAWNYLLVILDGTWRQGKEMYKVCQYPLPMAEIV